MTRTLLLLSIALIGLFTTPAHAADISIVDKVDQLIIIGFRGTSVIPKSDIDTILSYSNVGGVILFDYDSPTKTYNRNIKTLPQVKALTASLQERARTPLFIALDEEGGQVSRLKRVPGFATLPSARVVGMLPPQRIETLYSDLGKLLASHGINVNFAPVLDLASTNKQMPLTKQGRTFSTNPEKVAQAASQSIIGMHKSNIVTGAKHFPGLGEALLDSHLALPTVTSTSSALTPYKTLNTKGLLDMVMVAHVMDKAVDPVFPASLSKNHIGVLRNDIGFSGVIITDDLDMGAIKKKYTTRAAAVQAIKSGADMVIISNNITTYNKNAFFEVRAAILKAMHSGEIPVSRITEAYDRIIALKKHYGIVK